MTPKASIRLLYGLSICISVVSFVFVIVFLASHLWSETFTVVNGSQVLSRNQILSSTTEFCLNRFDRKQCSAPHAQATVLYWRFNVTRDGWFIKGHDGTDYPPTPVYTGTLNIVFHIVIVFSAFSLFSIMLQPIILIVLCVNVSDEVITHFWVMLLWSAQTILGALSWLVLITWPVHLVDFNKQFTLAEGCSVTDHVFGLTTRAVVLHPCVFMLNTIASYIVYITATFHINHVQQARVKKHLPQDYKQD